MHKILRAWNVNETERFGHGRGENLKRAVSYLERACAATWGVNSGRHTSATLKRLLQYGTIGGRGIKVLFDRGGHLILFSDTNETHLSAAESAALEDFSYEALPTLNNRLLKIPVPRDRHIGVRIFGTPNSMSSPRLPPASAPQSAPQSAPRSAPSTVSRTGTPAFVPAPIARVPPATSPSQSIVRPITGGTAYSGTLPPLRSPPHGPRSRANSDFVPPVSRPTMSRVRHHIAAPLLQPPPATHTTAPEVTPEVTPKTKKPPLHKLFVAFDLRGVDHHQYFRAKSRRAVKNHILATCAADLQAHLERMSLSDFTGARLHRFVDYEKRTTLPFTPDWIGKLDSVRLRALWKIAFGANGWSDGDMHIEQLRPSTFRTLS